MASLEIKWIKELICLAGQASLGQYKSILESVSSNLVPQIGQLVIIS